jgi:hypothetical protein
MSLGVICLDAARRGAPQRSRMFWAAGDPSRTMLRQIAGAFAQYETVALLLARPPTRELDLIL